MQANHKQPQKNHTVASEMLDIDNNYNLEAAESSSNFIQRIGFWLSTITSAASIATLLYNATLEALQQVFPDINQIVNNSSFIWGLIAGASLVLGFRLAMLMDFHLINIHGRAALTELFIFYKIWTTKKQNAALGRYRSGITFFRVVNATIQLLFLFIGYAASFFTSFLGSNEIGYYVMKNDGKVTSDKINKIEADKKKSLDDYTGQYKTALDEFYSQRKKTIEAQIKPYEKAFNKRNSVAMFKVDSTIKAINTQTANEEKRLNVALDKATKDWEDAHGFDFENQLNKAKKESYSKDNAENMFKSGLKFVGTFAITFSVLILVLQCMGEVSKKDIVAKEVDINKIVQAGTQGKNSNNNPN